MNPAVLNSMTNCLAHRGPDAGGHWITDIYGGRYQLAFGHRRLAILDLDAKSNQPMSFDDGRLQIVFNGEIYNYIELRDELRGLGRAFRTNSDTEVLIQAYDQWGLDAIGKFNGMFAFALWDSARKAVIFARDPFGKKPLYLHQTERLLAFSSEIESLLQVPEVSRMMDWQSVDEYLLLRYTPGPNTLFSAIKKLDPGTFGIWQDGAWQTTRYYEPPDAQPAQNPAPQGDVDSEFLRRLDRAVEIRMRSDAPFGAFLSGGLDSSTIVALMARHSANPVRTFSVGFAEEHASELKFARVVARAFETDHSEYIVNAQDLMDWLPQLVRHRGAPVAETADIPIFLMSRLAHKDVKMVLTGEGADETLAGYPKHRAEVLSRFYHALVPASAHASIISPLVKRLSSSNGRAGIFARAMGERDFAPRMSYWFGAMTTAERERLFPFLQRSAAARSGHPFSANANLSALRRILFFDQTSWLPDNLLERGDRMMMAASIEGRMPFLDRDLVSFVSSLPDHHRLRMKQGKAILRRAMSGVLPTDILQRRKMGFRVPVADWFRTTMADFIDDHLASANSMVRDYLSPVELDRILREHQSGAADHEKLIWSLLGLEIFHRQFKPDLSNSP